MAEQRRPVVPPPVETRPTAAGTTSAVPPASPSRADAWLEFPPSESRQRPSMQFSMRTMLFVVTGVAILAALASFVGPPFAFQICGYLLALAVSSVAPLCFGTLALYCRGTRQTFFLGSFVGSVIPLFAGQDLFAMSAFSSGIVLQIVVAAFNLMSALSFGWLALATRRFAERRGWHLPPSGTISEKRE